MGQAGTLLTAEAVREDAAIEQIRPFDGFEDGTQGDLAGP
jgi:hypothetical protein